jgi:hypothetical protein
MNRLGQSIPINRIAILSILPFGARASSQVVGSVASLGVIGLRRLGPEFGVDFVLQRGNTLVNYDWHSYLLSRRRSCLSAGSFRRPSGAINTPDGCAVVCRVPGRIKIHGIGGIGLKMRLRKQREPCNDMKGGFRFVPLNTRVFDPEVSVVMLAPIGHSFGI